MRSLRPFRTGTVAAVIVWKLAALTLLPAALCGQAVMAADGTAVPTCSCEGGEHGARCPMKRAADAGHGGHGDAHGDADAQANRPRMVGCNSLDEALLGMVSVTGFTPDTFELVSDPLSTDRVVEIRHGPRSLVVAPSPPPPRA